MAARPVAKLSECYCESLICRPRVVGRHIWVDVSGGMLNLSTEETLWCFIDITERKQSEQKLRSNEQRFRTFFEKNSSVMLLIEPASGEIIDANTAAAVYYGYP